MTKSITYVEIDIPSFVPESPEAIETWRFAMPADYLPPEIDAIPSIDSVSFTPARISLGKDLGERASLRISLRDHKHIFNGEPFDQGTFFGKWRGRYGTKLRGRELRLIRGQLGQSIEQMDTRYYVIESTDGPGFNGVYSIEAKDILKLADDDRAQAPALSNGSLAGSIDNAATEITLSPVGIGNAEYPASGWVCLGGKEVVSFTRSGDVLTITRAQFGTVAQAHSSGDRVQLVLRYAGDDPADIIRDLLVNYAGVPDSYIPLSDWQEETANFLGVIYAATITEPTSVRELVSEIIEQAALALWWDDRARRVRLNVLREISTETATFGHDRILEGSFKVKEQGAKRISQIWTYYGQRDPTDRGAEEDNYRAVLADADLQRETEYGSAEIRKVKARWIETETAATRLNSIQLSRFRDPPRSFAFDVFRDVAIAPAGGYQLQWWGSQDETGVEQSVPVQITHVRLEPDRVYVEAEEMLASGVVALVNVVFLFATDGSVEQFPLPETWNDNDNSVHAIGAGAGGARTGSDGGKGGGAGAYSSTTNLALSGSPQPSIQYRVGRRGRGGLKSGNFSSNGETGEDTWFGAATLGASLVGAKGGQGGSGRTGGGLGGQASSGVGDFKRSGGNAGNGAPEGETRAGGGGAGGAGGPNGDGGNGGNGTSTSQDSGMGGGGADGGESVGNNQEDGGDNRFNFGGGDSTTPAGQEGGGGRGGGNNNDGGPGGNGEQLWTQTVTPIVSAGPGGGGGGGGTGSDGGDGGKYGGGGGGAGEDGIGGDGEDGLIVIIWREASSSP